MSAQGTAWANEFRSSEVFEAPPVEASAKARKKSKVKEDEGTSSSRTKKLNRGKTSPVGESAASSGTASTTGDRLRVSPPASAPQPPVTRLAAQTRGQEGSGSGEAALLTMQAQLDAMLQRQDQILAKVEHGSGEIAVLREMQAQLERLLQRQEQTLLAVTQSPLQPREPKARGDHPESSGLVEVQQLERVAKAQEAMQKTLSKLLTATVTGSTRVAADKMDIQPHSSMKNAIRESAADWTVSPTMTDASKKRQTALQRELISELAEKADMEELKKVFTVADKDAKALADRRAKTYAERAKSMTTNEKAHLVDLWMGVVICINMVSMGLSLDHETTGFTLAVDVFLSVCFIWEVVMKVWLFGFVGHFCPPGIGAKLMTWNDTVIVIVDLLQLSLELATLQDGEETGSEMRTSLLRIFRLARVTRILRLLRLEAFQDLITMITGLAVGMPTLGWAIVLLFIFIYVVALVGRLALGTYGPDLVKQEFETVENALFAVFRCSFGDCTTKQGTSLLSLVIDAYGSIAGTFSALVIFFVTIGIFNVISAIFVEGTLTARMAAANEKKAEKLNDFSLFSLHMKKLLERVCEVSDVEQPDFSLDSIDEWAKLEVTTIDFKDACMQDEIVREALRELEIHEGDLPVLADILDPQNDLVLTLLEILHGITRLRGDPRRSDIVTVDLMIRDIQKSIGEVKDRLG